MSTLPKTLTRIADDAKGNPRYIVHYLDFLVRGDNDHDVAFARAKDIGFKKYASKKMVGYFVKVSHNAEVLAAMVARQRVPHYEWVRMYQGMGAWYQDIQAGLRSDGAWFFRSKSGGGQYGGAWSDWRQVKPFYDDVLWSHGWRLTASPCIRHSGSSRTAHLEPMFYIPRVSCPQEQMVFFKSSESGSFAAGDLVIA